LVDTSQYSIDEIKRFIVDKTGCDYEEVKDDADIDNDIGCTGDDFDELISDYSIKFHVNMDNYLWYFHTYEEGHSNSIGRLFFKSPYEKVKHIAVTPKVLLHSANAGMWTLVYPEHKLPKRRYDILINQIVIALFIIFVIYKCAK
jgi:hypothetical protein